MMYLVLFFAFTLSCVAIRLSYSQGHHDGFILNQDAFQRGYRQAEMDMDAQSPLPITSQIKYKGRWVIYDDEPFYSIDEAIAYAVMVSDVEKGLVRVMDDDVIAESHFGELVYRRE